MAKTKKNTATDEMQVDLQQQESASKIMAEKIEAAAESMIAEENAVVNDEVSKTEETSFKKPSVGEQIKNFFVNTWNKIKRFFAKLFKKDKAVAQVQQTDGADAVAATQPVVEEKLPFKVRFGRFCKAQSGWLFVLPAVILMCIFTFYPIGSAFVNAFKQDYNSISHEYNGWGFANFARVLKSDTGTGGATFVQCLVNTVVFTFISVPLSTLLALLISVALNSIKPLQKAYQTIFFLPYLTNSLAMGAVFATFFTIIQTPNNVETVGLFNTIGELFGLQPIDWMGMASPKWVISDNLVIPWAKYIVVIIYEVWSGLPFKILILFSALQSVNKQYYDAAKIDGASKNTVLWKITTPMISPMISYLLVTGIMGGMKQYTAIVGLFGEQMGINYDMGTMVGYIYQFKDNGYMGYAYAGSLILFAIIMVFTVINRYVSKKKVSY